MIVCEDEISLDLKLQVYHSLTEYGGNNGTMSKL